MEQWLRTGSPPDLDAALTILDGVCAGLAAIHAAETVHRLKPSNVLLDAQLKPHIADLGLAMICREDAATRSEIVGTPAYMAPEIAFASEFAPAPPALADVYSLGCLAYEMLTGAPPYEGEGPDGADPAAHGRYAPGAERCPPRAPPRARRHGPPGAGQEPRGAHAGRGSVSARADSCARGQLGAGAHSGGGRPRRFPRIARDHSRPRISPGPKSNVSPTGSARWPPSIASVPR